ncbi:MULTISPECIES: lipase family protein [Sutcliffiella]|uniref:lipase family protein n=1 Tax=Sutcliffiella TaxID=2837511 RepID=UPI0022DD50A1|nr:MULTISPECIES: lipase family protein [Sutcliffiella]MED4016055.1 lipase family protein [Sutcliffiella cohnii]WBL14241.1 lipase family protein [Sutcliffiella sp. NC1]
MRIDHFSKEWSVLLAECCQLAYDQFHLNGIFSLPQGFQLAKEFKGVSFHITEWFGFIIESEEVIVVAFRGTQTNLDWISDLEVSQEHFPYCSPSPLVHSGFLSIYNSVRDEIFPTLETLSKKKTLLITGHSLGGALATLLALECNIEKLFSSIIMYNYGSPRVGDEGFVEEYKKQGPPSIRFVNLLDLVPFVPTSRVYSPISKQHWYYRHIPNAIRFVKREGSVIKNHSIETYIAAVKEDNRNGNTSFPTLF